MAGIPIGDYFIGVIVDPLNNFVETDDTNNKGFSSVTFTVAGGTTTSGVDLVIDSVVFDNVNYDNFVVSFSNNGTIDAIDVLVAAYVSANTTLDSGDPIVFDAYVDGSGYINVAAEGSGSLTIYIEDLNLGTTGLADGYYYLIPKINSDDFIIETNYANNTGYDATWGVPIFPADSYESDDGFGSATAYSSGSPQTHSITSTDIDWFSVTLSDSTDYVVQTSSTGGGNDVDTYMYLYASDGTTIIDQNDDIAAGVFFSQIRFSPTTTGTFFIAIEGFSHADGGYYQLSIVEPVLFSKADYAYENKIRLDLLIIGNVDTVSLP